MNVLHYPEEVFAEIELQDQSMQFESMQLMKHRFDVTFPSHFASAAYGHSGHL